MAKNILLIDQYNKIGGGQSVLIDLIRACQAYGLICTVALPRGGYIESNVSGVSFYYLSTLNLSNIKKTLKDVFVMLFHFVREIKIIKEVKKNDIVYINGPRYYLMFYLFSYLVKRDYIYHIHLDFSRTGKKIIKLLSKQRNTKAIVFTSNYLKQAYIQEIGVTNNSQLSKLLVLEPGVSKKYEKQTLKSHLFKNSDEFNFLSIGRIYPEKGFDVIVALADVYPTSNFYIVGTPEDNAIEYFNELRNRASSNVYFLGRSEDIPKLILDHNINLGIVPSICNEAFGIVAIELMLCSCITFVSKRGGLVDIAKKTGAILFDNINDLKEKIDLFAQAEDKEKITLLGQQFFNTKANYGNDVFVNNVFGLLSTIVN